MTARLIVVPYDSGFRGRRMGAGPPALAAALRDAIGDVASTTVELPEEFAGEVGAAFSLQRAIARVVADARSAGDFPVVLAGNCNSAVGTVAGLTLAGAGEIGVCWFDAHADYHTPETTTSGFVDGMGLSMLTGRCWSAMCRSVPGYRAIPAASVILCGARGIDEGEREPLARDGVRRVSPNDLDALKAAIAAASLQRVYLHIDLDALDASEGRANGYACDGGYTARGLDDAVACIQRSTDVLALAFTAYDPAADAGASIARIAASVAANVIACAARFSH